MGKIDIDYLNKLKYALVQKPGLIAWHKNNYIGVICVFTGCGKTRMGVIGIRNHREKNPNETTLVVVPNKDLIIGWKAELKQMGVSEENITFLVRNSAAKLPVTTYFDNLIIDEIDTIIGNSYQSVLNIQYKRLLGLTATLDKYREKVLNYLNIKVVFKFDYNEALKHCLVDRITIYNVVINLNNDEYNKYNEHSVKIDKLTKEIKKEAPNFSVFNSDKEITRVKLEINSCYNAESLSTLKLLLKNMLALMYNISARKTIAIENDNKQLVLKSILEKIGDKQTIIFSDYTAILETSFRFLNDFGITNIGIKHSNQSKGELSKDLNYVEKFKNNKIQHLLTGKQLVAGFNMPLLKILILYATNGSSIRDTIQRYGRLVRLTGNEAFAILITTKNTVESDWVKSSNKDYEIINVDYSEENITNILKTITNT